MINRLRNTAVLQIALIVGAVSMLCSAGRTQTAPTVAFVYPASGTTFSAAYIGIEVVLNGFASVTNSVATIYDNAGHSFTSTGGGSSSNQWFNCPITQLIPGTATSYNGSITIQVTITGTKPGSPPTSVTAYSPILTDTVQIGYILGASNLNTATVTSPLNGATLHLVGTTSFTISSKHKFDFFRYDTFGTYGPTVNLKLQTTFPALSPYTTIGNESDVFQLPSQPGDVYQEYPLTHQETWSSSGDFNHQFLTQASSAYPSGSQIASDVTTATAIYP